MNKIISQKRLNALVPSGWAVVAVFCITYIATMPISWFTVVGIVVNVISFIINGLAAYNNWRKPDEVSHSSR